MATHKDFIETIAYPGAISIGVLQNGKTIAFISVCLKYPEKKDFYIGLLLMDNNFKNKGIGTGIINSLKKVAINLGFNDIQLSVQDNNIPGYSFWKKQGFCCIKETQCDGFVNLSMKYDL